MRLYGMVLLVALLGCTSTEDIESDESAVVVSPCVPPSPGVLDIASRWVRPGTFVNVTIKPGAKDVRVTASPLDGSKGEARVEPTGDAGYVVRFDKSATGFFSIKARSGSNVAGEVLVRVADLRPSVTSERVMLPASTETPVSLIVKDPAGDGVRIAVGQNTYRPGRKGQLDVRTRLVHGINFVPVVITDAACNPFPTTAAVIAAPSFKGDGEAVIQANQAALDVATTELGPELPRWVVIPAVQEPVAEKLGFRIHFDGASIPGQVSAADNSRLPGNLRLKVTLQANQLGVELRAEGGDVIAHGRINDKKATIRISNFATSGVVRLQNGRVSVDVGKLDGDMKFDLDGFPDWVGSWFEDKIRSSSIEAIEKVLPGVIEQSVLKLEGALPIPALRETPSSKPASLKYALEKVTISPDHLSTVIRTTYPGAPHFGARVAPLQGATTGLAVGFDTLNQILYALWESKGLSWPLDATDLKLVGTELEKLEPTIFKDAHVQVLIDGPKLPPVVVGTASPGVIRVAVAEVPVHVLTDSANFSSELTSTVGFVADVRVEKERASLADLVEVHVNPGSSTGVAGLRPDALGHLFEWLAQNLAKEMASSLTVPLGLPVFDLTGLDLHSSVTVDAPKFGANAGALTVTGSPRVKK